MTSSWPSAGGAMHSQATLVVSSDVLSDGTTVVCDAENHRLSFGGNSGVLSGRRVEYAPSQGEVASLLASSILAQPAAPAAATHYYVIAGSGIDDAMLLRTVALVCAQHPADAYAHMFASADSSQLVCETLTYDDLQPFAVPDDLVVHSPRAASNDDASLPPLRGIQYITLVFRSGEARAVIVGGPRISISMISLLEVGGGGHTSVFLSIGSQLSPAHSLSLIHEVEALMELLKGDRIDEVPSASPPALVDLSVVAALDEHRSRVAALEAELLVSNRRVSEAHAMIAAEREAAGNLRQLLDNSQGALAQAVHRVAVFENQEQARARDGHERHQREQEKQQLVTDSLQSQVHQLLASNRILEARTLEHQNDREEYERERRSLQRQIEAAEQRAANMSSTILEAKEEFQRHQKAMQHELMQTAMEFQQRERQWQRELAEAFHGREDQDRCVAELEARVEAQAVAAARDAEQFASRHHDSEMEFLLHQVKALSPLGKLMTLSASASPFRNHHPLASHGGGAFRLDPYPTNVSSLSFQRDQHSPSHTSARRSPSGGAHRMLVSPHPGDRNLDF